MRIPVQSQPVIRGTATTAAGVMPSVDVGCIISCAGVSALKCLSCGTNIGCWAKCAGPGVVACVTGCL